MPRFTVRVELHNAEDKDYENLHKFMEEENFLRTISLKNVKYKLPTAEYIISDNDLDPFLTLDKAKSAASKTEKKYEVLVTESNGRTQFGLEKV